jgi:hypothetical protein
MNDNLLLAPTFCLGPFLICDVAFNHKQKYLYFDTIFHILVQGHPMIDFEGLF